MNSSCVMSGSGLLLMTVLVSVSSMNRVRQPFTVVVLSIRVNLKQEERWDSEWARPTALTCVQHPRAGYTALLPNLAVFGANAFAFKVCNDDLALLVSA
jgi:hypothetical protein